MSQLQFASPEQRQAYEALQDLKRNGGRLTPDALAYRLGIPYSSATRRIRNLVATGMLREVTGAKPHSTRVSRRYEPVFA